MFALMSSLDELQSICRRGRTRRKIGTASDAAKSFELLKSLARGQPRVTHVVKTCNIRETHVIIRVPTVIKTWGDAIRRESLGVRLGQSTVIARVLRVGITGNSVCLAAYHRQMDFSVLRQSLGSAQAVLRQCFRSGTAADGHTPYKARPSQNWPKITTYDHVHQIFITSCAWFRRGVLYDRGFNGFTFQQNFNKNTASFIEHTFEYVAFKMAVTLSQPHCL